MIACCTLFSVRSASFLTVLASLSFVACGQRSSGYDDCILQHVEKGMDQMAVRAIAGSCRAKFPAQSAGEPVGTRELSGAQRQLLTGRAGVSYGNRYSGTLYNGNEGLMVTRVELAITTTIGNRTEERTYRSDVTVAPKSAADFAFDIIIGDEGSKYNWRIERAWGHPVK